MKIINPASNYYNKFSTAKVTPNKGGAADSVKFSGSSESKPATGMTASLESLANMSYGGKSSAGVTNLACDIYKMGNSSVYAALSHAQKSGISKFLDSETDLSEVYVYASENVEVDSTTLADFAAHDPAAASNFGASRTVINQNMSDGLIGSSR